MQQKNDRKSYQVHVRSKPHTSRTRYPGRPILRCAKNRFYFLCENALSNASQTCRLQTSTSADAIGRELIFETGVLPKTVDIGTGSRVGHGFGLRLHRTSHGPDRLAEHGPLEPFRLPVLQCTFIALILWPHRFVVEKGSADV